MSHLETPMMRKMYPNGYPREKNTNICSDVQRGYNGMGGICIIDNPHPGRKHWGPDTQGVYREWLNEEVKHEEANRWSDDHRWVGNDPNRRRSR